MCQFENGFKLCTCEKGDTKEAAYIWELLTLDRIEFAQGRCSFPSQDIGSGLEHEWVEINLNCEPCFDFDYQPKGGDNLVIYDSENRYARLSFIYANGIWGKGFYDEICEISKLKCKGTVSKR